MVNNNTPKDIGLQRIIGMDNKISCVHNLSCGRYVDVRLNFEYLIHGFAHYFNVALYPTTKKSVVAKCGILLRPVSHKGFYLQD